MWVNWHLPWWCLADGTYVVFSSSWETSDLYKHRNSYMLTKWKWVTAGLIAFALLHHSLHPPVTRMCCCVEHFHRHPWLLASGWVCRLCGERIWSFPWSLIQELFWEPPSIRWPSFKAAVSFPNFSSPFLQLPLQGYQSFGVLAIVSPGVPHTSIIFHDFVHVIVNSCFIKAFIREWSQYGREEDPESMTPHN